MHVCHYGQCSCYTGIWQEKSWLKKSYFMYMMEVKRNVEMEYAPLSQQSASFHPVHHPTQQWPMPVHQGKGESAPWECVAFPGKQIIDNVLLRVSLLVSCRKIAIVMAEQECSVPRVESKGSRLENVGTSIRRNMLICPWFPPGAKPLRAYLMD